jgi:two-component system, cell cycle response regulator
MNNYLLPNAMNMKQEEIFEVSILIVDDQPANLKVLAKMLEGKNYKVRKALDGESALMAAQANPPDLILLDIKMPDLNGYQVCQQLKSQPITKNIPVIFISALSETFDKLTAFEVGGIDYITKPFQEEEVMARINSQLTIQKQQKALIKEREKLRQEIQQRQEAEAILYQSRALISSILNSSLDGIAALEAVRNPKNGQIADFRCLVVNPIIGKIFNRNPQDLMGKLLFKKIVTRIDPRLFDAFVKLVETGQTLNQELSNHTGLELKWYQLIAVKLGDGFSLTVRDITERKKLDLKLTQLATIDGLTGIANRRNFDLTLEREWKRCQREEKPLSLILIDLDFFKKYNDHYGHQAGDDCLRKIALTMTNLVKRSTDLVARYGGEEFAIILPNTNSEGAIKIAEIIREKIQILQIRHEFSNISNYVTLSLGIATMIPTSEISPEKLINQADQSLYKAKSEGRDRWSKL